MKKWYKYLLVFVSTGITGLGITFVLFAELGVDPISTFLLGVLNFIPIRFGTGSQIFSLVFLIINYYLDRKYFGLGGLIFSLGCGYCINLYSHIGIVELLSMNSMPNIIIALMGIFLFGIGTGLFLFTKTGTGPLEGPMFFFSQKLNLTIKVTRIALDGSLVVIGIALGAKYGIGTILCILFIGPIIERSLRTFLFLDKWLKREEEPNKLL
ncbi:hypothetical protein CHH62_22280 [Niallia circulans]|jgi:uncharacterized protein|uniref:YczE/YyaS/YitT family protein n=1 Tax=Niallia circulans TaxID=1397 RepID=UPI000BA515CB|nr:hypothetical protein [Niallia circulans]PAD23483.1 hypothetical protein CHH62_22280 [Niallia circulans]